MRAKFTAQYCRLFRRLKLPTCHRVCGGRLGVLCGFGLGLTEQKS
jgi:hypothetical protein